jgi:hypothetical protein
MAALSTLARTVRDTFVGNLAWAVILVFWAAVSAALHNVTSTIGSYGWSGWFLTFVAATAITGLLVIVLISVRMRWSAVQGEENAREKGPKVNVRAVERRLTETQDRMARLDERLDGIEERCRSSFAEVKEQIASELEGARETKNFLMELHHLTSLKLAGLHLLSKVTPENCKSDDRWKSIENNVGRFISDIIKIEHEFDREGLYSEYYIDRPAPREEELFDKVAGDTSENPKLRSYRVNYHYIVGALARLDQAEKQTMKEMNEVPSRA